MFEIGNSLREARLRQGTDLARSEADTKIRAKYLQALEDERFDLLPAETYVKGFLRTYADYLGLDGQLYVDEFNSRFATAEEPIVAQRDTRRSRPRSDSNFVVVALAGIVAVTVLVVVAWQVGTDGSEEPQDAGNLIGLTASAAPGPAPPVAQPPAPTTTEVVPATPKVKAATVVLNAVRGDCWLEVHAGSAAGEILYQGTLEIGQTQRFKRKRLWISLGAGEHLDVKINGTRVDEFPAGAAVVVINAKGVRTVSTV